MKLEIEPRTVVVIAIAAVLIYGLQLATMFYAALMSAGAGTPVQ